ncbi:hypothetical protein CACET_c32040 [Clostridium aceticum]|uniref:Uncharacterized protein n=1 Tax=Clostridium aceticum TaxID=84022 RepID=A0A0G3WE56_9CLOT|nr:hypothetical protein [Clostridium aceticum]AKL96648.1 hypothetical protein CACET_c32040 [Clostridium aceticum]
MSQVSKNCGGCNFFNKGQLVPTIGKCFVTNETKKANEYCTKTEYYRPKDQEVTH